MLLEECLRLLRLVRGMIVKDKEGLGPSSLRFKFLDNFWDKFFDFSHFRTLTRHKDWFGEGVPNGSEESDSTNPLLGKDNIYSGVGPHPAPFSVLPVVEGGLVEVNYVPVRPLHDLMKLLSKLLPFLVDVGVLLAEFTRVRQLGLHKTYSMALVQPTELALGKAIRFELSIEEE